MLDNLFASLSEFFAAFEKQTYTMADVANMQDNGELPKLIVYAVPIMLSCVLLEYIISQFNKKRLYSGKDFLASVGIGVGNLASTLILNGALFAVVLFFYNLSPWTIPVTWWSMLLCLICMDFGRYWAHRVAHEQRIWWATHVPHHSSEEYNFSVSFRLSWVQQVKVIFFLPIALLGFHPVVFFVCNQIEVLYQFWIHTKVINRMPWIIEFIFVTPSHHRVHHARNPKYIDKNFGSSLIIWDRMFGTFQAELEELQPDYGITTPPDSYNPAFLVFHEFIDIFKDFFHARDWRSRMGIIFGYPGTYMARVEEENAKKMSQEQPKENKQEKVKVLG